jgi:DNA polymerase III psi subunit
MSDLILPNDWQNQQLYVFFDTKKAENVHLASNPIATIIVYTISLTAENRLFLDKILQALNIQVDTHINILEYNNDSGIDIQEYLQTQPTQRVWWIGIQPKNAGWQMNWQPYKIYTVGEKQHFISHNLDIIAEKQDLKRQLWQTIQVFFANKENEI